jgi:hypothetical protein
MWDPVFSNYQIRKMLCLFAAFDRNHPEIADVNIVCPWMNFLMYHPYRLWLYPFRG